MPTYRTLFRNEADELAAHYLRLAPDDRTLRFFGKVSDEFIRLHCQQIDWLRTTIVGCVIDGEVRGAAELHAHPFPARQGEIAVSVEQAFQRQGIGTELIRRVLGRARNRQLQTLYLSCLPENGPMQRMAKKFSGDLRLGEDDIRADITVSMPNLMSLQEEAFANGLGLLAQWDRAVRLGI